MKATYEQILSDLKHEKYAPVYLFYGDEPYYISKLGEYMEKYVLDDAAKSFDQQVFYGKDLSDISPVINAARRFPMMGDRQMIILKEAQMLKKWENFQLYWKNPMQSTILVVCYKGKPDKRLLAFKDIEKSCTVLESAPLREYEVGRWILDYIRQWNATAAATNQVKIDEKVVQVLAESLGTDLTRITMELQKLVNGRPEGVNVIDADLVQRNIGISKDYNTFELQDAFVKKDILKANRITQYFAANKKDHAIQKELAMVFSFFSNLMIYHYLSQKDERSVAQALGISPYFAKNYAAAARQYNAGKTFKIIGYIRETDARSKGIDNISADDSDLWKELVYKIMH
ncbi:MAG: DNA polymerase III subunit delta [Paludibacteraceae bacterium]|nr:DNA polymerase III subunit delta [Paludibacteraceae bacterium]